MDIDLKNLSFNYNGKSVLESINQYIPSGDFVAIVGPNGSGKSTLLRCMDGILKPKQGSIHFNELSINDLSANERAKLLGYVPQQTTSTPPASVYDTVLLGRKPHIGWKASQKDHEITNEIIYKLDIQDIALRDINKLSGGQRQRVFIARALAQQPYILLLDEPTANLDIKHQLEVLSLLRSIAEQDITVIIAIHDLNLAMQYCRHFIMLKNGQIFASGTKNILTKENIEQLYEIHINMFAFEDNTFFVPQKQSNHE